MKSGAEEEHLSGIHIGFDARWYFEGPPSNRLVTKHLLPQLVKIRPRDKITALVHGGKTAAGKLEDECGGVRAISVPDLTMLGGAITVIPWLLFTKRVDVFVAQNFVPPFGAKRRIGFVYDTIFLRQPQLFTPIERVYLHGIKSLAKRSDHICTISFSEREALVEWKLATPDQTSVIHLAPRPEIRTVTIEEVEAARRELGLPERYILCLGRVNVRKNLMAVLRACELARCVTQECPLLLAGPVGGQQEPGLAEFSSKLEDRVLSVGYVPERLVPGLVAGATTFVSFSLFEGFGLPPLEALAAGVPVLMARSAVAEEIVGDAVLYVDDITDAQAAAALLDMLTNDEVLRRLQKEKGRLRASTYTWEKSAAALSSAIDRVWDGG